MAFALALWTAAPAAFSDRDDSGTGAAEPSRTGAPRDTVSVAPPIVVPGRHVDPRISRSERSGFVSIVDLSARRDRVEDLPFLLAQMPGLRVQRYGGLGSLATVSIRGSSSSQVNVYVDGVPVNDPYLGVANIADFPLGSADYVEVYRGFSPPRFGSSAIGGAINLVTGDKHLWDRPRTLAAIDASASYGSFDTSREQVTMWLKPSRLRVKLHAGHDASRGDFDFFDDNGTPIYTGDDEWAVRANNDGTASNVLVRLETDLGDAVTVSAVYDGFERSQGVPGLGNNQSLTARSERSRQLGHAGFETVPLGGQMRLFGTAYYSRSRDHYADVESDVALLAEETENRIDVYGGRARARWLVPIVPFAVELSHDARKEEFHPVDLLPHHTEGPENWRHAQTTAATGELYLFGESFVLSGTVRWEHYEAEYWEAPRLAWLPPTPTGRFSGEARTPSAGVRWQIQRWLTVKGNAGRYYRLPTFLEMFGNVGSVTGNPSLVPEEGRNRDVGVVVSLDRVVVLEDLKVEVTWVDNEAQNLILFFPNSQNTARPVNIGAARIRGWETGVSTGIASAFLAAVGYTYLDARDTGPIPYLNGNLLPSRPRGDLNVSLSALWGRWRFTYEFNHLGANFTDRTNLREVPARDLHNLIGRVGLPVPGLTFTLEARNITGNQVSDIYGYPLPGRAVFATLRYRN